MGPCPRAAPCSQLTALIPSTLLPFLSAPRKLSQPPRPTLPGPQVSAGARCRAGPQTVQQPATPPANGATALRDPQWFSAPGARQGPSDPLPVPSCPVGQTLRAGQSLASVLRGLS